MKLRHAAALALVGWYLIMPPLTGDMLPPKPPIDDGAPYGAWEIIGFYDTAASCMAAIEATFKRRRRRILVAIRRARAERQSEGSV